MKNDILPDLDEVELMDRVQKPVTLRVGLYDSNGCQQVFMAEHQRHGPSSIAANSLVYIQQLQEKFSLSADNCEFYRYVFSPVSGPVLGRFILKWSGDKPVSYSMRMLSQLELESFSRLLGKQTTTTAVAAAQ